MFIGTDLLDFIKYFSDDDDCLKYIADIKWPDASFKCKKCGNTNFCKGKQNYSRRCTKCKFDESPTSGTKFERLGFDLLRAFHILYALSVRKKGISIIGNMLHKKCTLLYLFLLVNIFISILI